MPYATVSDVKLFLNIVEDDDDAILADLVDQAQAQIERHTHRIFAAASDTTRTFNSWTDTKGATLFFDEDCAAITTITNGDLTTVASSSYVTLPVNRTPIYAIRLLSSVSIGWEPLASGDPDNAISIAGRWAYSTTPPDDIVYATMRLTAWMYRQRDTSADSDRPILTADGVTVLPNRIPADVQTILMPYIKGYGW